MPEGPQQTQQIPEIRTMRDDLASAKKGPAKEKNTPVKPKKLPPPPKYPISQTLPSQKMVIKDPGAGKPQTIKKAEEKPKKERKSRIFPIIVTLFVVTLMGAAGVWAWVFFGDQLQPQESPTSEVTEPQPLANVLPNSALMIAYYKISNDQERTALIQNWNQVGEGQEATMRDLLAGDPRLILENTTATEFAYVLLAGDPRLYFVVPNSSELENIIAERSNVQETSIAQWKVLHSFSTDMYKEALTAGSQLLENAPQSFGAPLTVYVSEELTQQLDPSNLLKNQAGDGVVVSFRIAPNGLTANFVREDIIEPDVPTVVPSGSDFVNRLAADIPENPEHVVFGANFSQTSGISANSPAAQDLISQLTGPYAYFRRIDDAGLETLGLIVDIPQTAQNTFELGNPQIESALVTMIPQYIGITKELSQLVFVDNTHAGLNLRYVNIDTVGNSIDYSIRNNKLYIATSKLGMFALAETVNQDSASLADSKMWAPLIAEEYTGYDQVAVSTLTIAAIRSILPQNLSEELQGVPFRADLYNTPAGNHVSGAAVLQIPELGASQ